MPLLRPELPSKSLRLLTPAQMLQAEQASMAANASDTAGHGLMQRAAQAVAMAIQRRWQPCRIAVLCGPGNNGGDGYVVAHLLRQQGWSVQVFSLTPPQQNQGDAAWAALQWGASTQPLSAFEPTAFDLAVDAIFGAGLNRALGTDVNSCLQACAQAKLPICAVDMPSGVDGSTGQLLGQAAAAALTVTFSCAKPGHFLLPGKDFCGELLVADIGLDAACLQAIGSHTCLNAPALWDHLKPPALPSQHKYKRGHVVVLGGEVLTGAARLAAQAAQRSGAGLVTIAAPASVWGVYAQALQGCMVQSFTDGDALRSIIQEPRRNVCLIGPGAGVLDTTRQAVLESAAAGKQLVLDADALTAFAQQPQVLFDALAALAKPLAQARAVLTPHDGEFARLFGHLSVALGKDKCAQARLAAQRAQAVVVLKGADTVIAAPDGRLCINANAPATLATGGTGDVLAGLVAGLLAQGMPAFEAACAAVWLHGQAAQQVGPGLIAEDLLHALA
ncbi:NAD(P)H-hydrate dehydratase [Lampropedia aestuarii]|uniref:NAD(P)H-hydrate dehydratase n=1 Tax=Lampropedia aestuarii TaxID=2562762 RepID=UPI002468C17A|nr:NAD(P)H-hydrate dehydratase [Lampropedia aestuarii]MDH5857071.1 NAD(P)H-hydrate dehydratase [Lampropedia aestuarii]